MPPTPRRELIVVGDRVLIKPNTGEERTEVGLVLPDSVVSKEKVQGGLIVNVGPGLPLPSPEDEPTEPWREGERMRRYLPMQAEVGDHALFLKKHAVEVRFEGQEYLVVPHQAILVIVRDEVPEAME